MEKLNRLQILEKLKAEQAAIVYESDEDEGAQEFYGELQSVIDAINEGRTDKEIQDAANWVGVTL